MPETRRIEKYGILKLTQQERGANNLIVQTDVIQLPVQEYLNTKTNPPRSHYGYACFMSREYVLSVVDIQFRRQILVDRNRYLVQLAWQEFCNSKTILEAVSDTSPDTTVDYPIWLCDEIRFKLEPGVILNVFKSHIPPITCSGTGIREPDNRGDAPGLPTNPSPAPPSSVPNESRIPLSPPYEGNDDNGNTYVRVGQSFSYTVKVGFRERDNCEFVGVETEETYVLNEPNVTFSFELTGERWDLVASNGFRRDEYVTKRCEPYVVSVTTS